MLSTDKVRLSRKELEVMNPKDLRQLIREGKWDPDPTFMEYACTGYSHHGVCIVPRDYAYDYLVFSHRNPRAMYTADICDVGSPHPPFLAPDADVRTDCHQYRVYRDGVLVDQPSDIMKYWREDLVAFFTACSFNLEGVMRQTSIRWRHMGNFRSNLRGKPAGRFRCDNMVVFALLFPTSLDAIRAILIASRLPVTHGYPIHIGDPAEIGVDLSKPDTWTPSSEEEPVSPQQPNEIAVFWGAAVSAEYAIRDAKPPLAIMHYAARTFVSDRRIEELQTSFTT